MRRVWWARMTNGQIPQEAVKGGEDGKGNVILVILINQLFQNSSIKLI